jgi:ribosomal protein S6
MISEFESQKKKLSNLEREFKHQLSLLTNPIFSDDAEVQKVYVNTKKRNTKLKK